MFFIYTYLFHTQQLYTPCSDQNVHTQSPKHCTIVGNKTGLQGYSTCYDTRCMALVYCYQYWWWVCVATCSGLYLVY
jgi:hypothetical protein